MTDELNYLYRKLSLKHRSVVQDYLDTLGLYIGQPRFLFELSKNPGMTQVELSQSLQVSKEIVSVSLRRLESAGFIVRVQSEVDKRNKHLYLSDRGETVVVELRDNFDRINNAMYSLLSDEQIDQIISLFNLMIDGLEKEV